MGEEDLQLRRPDLHPMNRDGLVIIMPTNTRETVTHFPTVGGERDLKLAETRIERDTREMLRECDQCESELHADKK